jgi:hypothetical protein
MTDNEKYEALLANASRFWSLVDKESDTNGCWIWFGTIHNAGYGAFRIGEKKWIAHRAAWMLTHGPITSEEWVCHRCDNRACVNSSHHFLGDQLTNVADMVSKGRQCRGERKSKIMLAAFKVIKEKYPHKFAKESDRNSNVKLTKDAVRLIRESEMTSLALSPIVGVDASTIRKIRRCGTWKSVVARMPRKIHLRGRPPCIGAKLSFEDVQFIRAHDDSDRKLAAKYGVHHSTISGIRRGELWKQVTEESI